MKHLNYCILTAWVDHKESRHPQLVMKELGITYQHATPQSLNDTWWFWNCENVPDELPSYLTVSDWDPMKMIGWGLSEENAILIRDYKRS